jgi:hypothetical protein
LPQHRVHVHPGGCRDLALHSQRVSFKRLWDDKTWASQVGPGANGIGGG